MNCSFKPLQLNSKSWCPLNTKVEILPIHKAQLLSYIRLMDIPLGLLINFHELRLKDGVHHLILPGAGKKTENNNDQASLTEGSEDRKV